MDSKYPCFSTMHNMFGKKVAIGPYFLAPFYDSLFGMITKMNTCQNIGRGATLFGSFNSGLLDIFLNSRL